jgi:hypothetical protein
MTNKAFEREELKRFRERFDEVMKPLLEEFNVSIRLGGITFNPSYFKGSLMVSRNIEGAEVANPFAGAFVDCAPLHGLKKEALGKTFTTPSGTYKITGYKKSARKYPFIAEDVKTGKSYKFTKFQVRGYIDQSLIA